MIDVADAREVPAPAPAMSPTPMRLQSLSPRGLLQSWENQRQEEKVGGRASLPPVEVPRRSVAETNAEEVQARLMELRQGQMLEQAAADEELAQIMDEYRTSVSQLELDDKKSRAREETRFTESFLETNAVRRTIGSRIGDDPGRVWERHLDGTTGTVYYFNTGSGASQWECPEELDKPSELEGGKTGEMLECAICLDVYRHKHASTKPMPSRRPLPGATVE